MRWEIELKECLLLWWKNFLAFLWLESFDVDSLWLVLWNYCAGHFR